MHIINLDLKHGSVSINSKPIEIDEKGALADSIAKLCPPPIHMDQEQTRYYLSGKVSVCGQSADCVIEAKDGKTFSVAFLFDLIEFFESSILESKIIRTCERSLNLEFKSNHPSTAFLLSPDWGSAAFYYDAKQGDLSLDIIFERESNRINSKA